MANATHQGSNRNTSRGNGNNNNGNGNRSEEREEKRESIGALWERTSKSGDKYMVGFVKVPSKREGEGDLRLVCFTNRDGGTKNDQGKTRPNFRIFESLPVED